MTELRGPLAHIVWEDGHLLMTHETGWRSRLVVGGRGYGKRARMEALRAEYDQSREDALHKQYGMPWAKSITWACKPPTAPMFPTGSAEWMMEQAIERVMPLESEHIRKLNAQMAAKVSAIHDILGVTPHGSNDPQVP